MNSGPVQCIRSSGPEQTGALDPDTERHAQGMIDSPVIRHGIVPLSEAHLQRLRLCSSGTRSPVSWATLRESVVIIVVQKTALRIAGSCGRTAAVSCV